MDVAAALPRELRLFLIAFVAAVASYVLLTSFAFMSTPRTRTPVIRPQPSVRVVHIRPSDVRSVVHGGAHR